MTFAYPLVLWLLASLPLLTAWSWWRARKQGGLGFPNLSQMRLPRSWRVWMAHSLPILRLLAMALLIVALARPQHHDTVEIETTEGIDIMLALDASTSMRATDFPPNRFEAARDVAQEFVQSRDHDRIGLVVFAGEAFTQAPLTTDGDFLHDVIEQLSIGQFEPGTAIGSALATALNRLEESEAPSQVVILLTDGQNNRGEIDPLTAAEMARVLGVRVYTIGVGSFGDSPFEPESNGGTDEVDEDVLTTMAEATGGRYFRASNTRALRTIYDDIGELEQAEIETYRHTDVSERYARFAVPGLLLILLHTALRTTVARRVP